MGQCSILYQFIKAFTGIQAQSAECQVLDAKYFRPRKSKAKVGRNYTFGPMIFIQDKEAFIRLQLNLVEVWQFIQT